jgi:hypothetical protein
MGTQEGILYGSDRFLRMPLPVSFIVLRTSSSLRAFIQVFFRDMEYSLFFCVFWPLR